MKIFRVGIVIVAFALLAFAGCEKGQMVGQEGLSEEAAKTAEGSATAAGPEAVSAATVVLKTQSGDKPFTVEIAQSEQERINGLSGRESIAPNAGMWFIFPENSLDDFWMQGMLFDLDIIFVGDDMKVINKARGDKNNPTARISPTGPYRFVLEVAAGSADGVQPGDVVEYRIGPQ